jgi:hypothetical protein
LGNETSTPHFSAPAKSSEKGVWKPEPIDVSSVNLNNELSAMTLKFAEHFHDSWASRKVGRWMRRSDSI